MLGIGLRAAIALRSGAKDMSALEAMRALPRHREAALLPASVAQEKFSDFVRKYTAEPPATRGAIFREFCYAVAAGSFTGPMEPLANHFAATFAKDADHPAPEPGHLAAAAQHHPLSELAQSSSRSSLRALRQKVAHMERDERLEVWRAAAGVERDTKWLGPALLEAEAHQALQDCSHALANAPVQTPKSAAPELLVIAAIRALSKNKKVQNDINVVLQSVGSARGRSRSSSASEAPTPAEAQAALRLPKVTKSPYASLRDRGAAGAETDKVSTVHFPDQPQFSGLMSPTFGRGNFTKIKLLRAEDGAFYAVRTMRTSDKKAHGPEGASAPPAGPKQTARTVPNDIWNEERVLDLIDSPVRSLARGIDDKGRTFSVVRLYDGNVELMMELLQGPPKAAVLSVSALRVLETLAKLEAQGLVHGDIKPDNLLFDLKGDVALADFGKAHAAAVRGPDGAKAYAPPERISPDFETTPKYDLYSLGLTLVHMTIGQAFSYFPLKPKGGYAQTKMFYDSWRAHRAGTSSGAAEGPHRVRLQMIDEAHAAMAALDPVLADIVFFQLLEADPSRRGDSATALRRLRGDGPDRAALAQSFASVFEQVTAEHPAFRKVKDLKASLAQAAALPEG